MTDKDLIEQLRAALQAAHDELLIVSEMQDVAVMRKIDDALQAWVDWWRTQH